MFCLVRFFLGSAAPVTSSWLTRFGVPFTVSRSLSVVCSPLFLLPVCALRPVCVLLPACFCLVLLVSGPSFRSPQPRPLSLSLCSSCSSPIASGGCSLLAPVAVFDAVKARVVPRYLYCGVPVGTPQFLCGCLPVHSFPPSWWGPALLVFP